MKTAVLLAFALGCAALRGQVMTSNLLVNAGGETGSLSGWTTGGSIPPMVASTNPPGTSAIPPHTGQFVFKGGPNPNGYLQQRIMLLDHGLATNQIDAGRLVAHVGFWQQSFRSTAEPAPVASITLIFRDQQGQSIEGYISTPELAALAAYTNYQTSFPVPAGCRAIDYLMNFFTFSGAAGDSYLDDNSLTISETNPDPTVAAAIRVAAVEICWASKSNTLYQIDYRSSLTTNLWVPWGSPIPGTGGTHCLTDDLRGQSQRYYRVRELP